MKFVIFTGRPNYGGTIVLHTLCRHLNNLGVNAKVYYAGCFNYQSGHKVQYHLSNIIFLIKDTIRILLVKIFGEKRFIHSSYFRGYVDVAIKAKRKIFPFIDKNTVVVYPEIVYGNPLKARHVVRWFLYFYKYEKNYDAYSKSDLFIAYRDIFNNRKLNPENYTLTTPYFDLELYKRTNFGKRDGSCFIIRKGRSRDDLPDTFDGPIIDNLSEKDKVEMFNQCKYCISYDTQTAYSGLAALCGCISIVVPEKGKKRKDYLCSGENGFGVAYGFDESEIKFALETQTKLKKEYEDINRKSESEIIQFVELCKEFFNLEK